MSTTLRTVYYTSTNRKLPPEHSQSEISSLDTHLHSGTLFFTLPSRHPSLSTPIHLTQQHPLPGTHSSYPIHQQRQRGIPSFNPFSHHPSPSIITTLPLVPLPQLSHTVSPSLITSFLITLTLAPLIVPPSWNPSLKPPGRFPPSCLHIPSVASLPTCLHPSTPIYQYSSRHNTMVTFS